MTSEDDSLDPLLVRGAASAGVGPCPDASEVAGFAEGSLTDAEAERVAAHAAGCGECRAAIVERSAADDARAGDVVPARPARPRLRPLASPRRVAIAATVLVAVGIGAVLLARSAGERPPADVDARLVAATSELATVEPGIFQGFSPLSRAERIAVRDERERGGVKVLGPIDVVLSDRPTFRWVEVPGTAEYDVTVAPEGGAPSWKRTAIGGSLPYPPDVSPLVRGTRYAWVVETEGVLGGRTKTLRTFVVASREEAEAFARAERTIAARAPSDVSSLLAAHWALRHRLLDEAERLTRAHLARDPDGAAGRETLAAILRRRGTPDDATTPGGSPR